MVGNVPNTNKRLESFFDLDGRLIIIFTDCIIDRDIIYFALQSKEMNYESNNYVRSYVFIMKV